MRLNELSDRAALRLCTGSANLIQPVGYGYDGGKASGEKESGIAEGLKSKCARDSAAEKARNYQKAEPHTPRIDGLAA